MDEAATARRAIEQVCVGRADLAQFYSETFVDHVNALEFRGHDGIRRSVALYRELFPDIAIRVDDQVTDGERVASRWTLTGTNRGRGVTLTGITISRFEDGLIVEDWGATDTVELARQLGVWRSLLLAAKHWRLLLNPTGG